MIGLILIAGLYSVWSYSSPFAGIRSPVIPCQQPLTYQITHIDQRYDLDRDELMAIMKEVEKLWEQHANRELLQFSKNGQLSINLMYGKEQKRSENSRRLMQKIENNRQRLSSLKQVYSRLAKTYEERKESLQEAAEKYNNLLQRYQHAVENNGNKSRKGSSVASLKRQVTNRKNDLHRQRDNTEFLRKRVNTKSKQINNLIQRQKDLISKYNSKFGAKRKFDQGRYTKKGQGQRIDIFQFGSRAELKTVLAHESGHALGIGHLPSSTSVMHRYMADQNIFNPDLGKADIEAVKGLCKD